MRKVFEKPEGGRNVTRVRVCAKAELEVGSIISVQVEGRAIALCRSTPDEYYAVRDICPHQGATLSAGELSGTNMPSHVGVYDYGLEYKVLRCPWHNYEFDVRTGEQLFINPRPADARRLRVRTFPVVIEGEDVYLELDR